MADATQILTEMDISATATKGPYTVGLSPMPVQRWFWRVKLQSGSGSNTLHILPQQVANYEDASSDQQVFDMDDSDHFDFPAALSSELIDAETADTWTGVFECANNVRRMKFVFTYLGTGSRTFRIDLWVD